MASTFKHTTPEAIQTALTTELNSLANGAYSNASGAIDNLTGLYTHMALELYLDSLTPVAGQTIAVYLVPSIDGTNYEDGGGAVAPPAISYLCSFDLRAAAAAQRRAQTDIPIPPFAFKLILGNLAITSGVALAAANNTLKYRRYYMQAV
jgi:hypothetical protein